MTRKEMQTQQRTIVVTGAGTGIGRAIALALGGSGARLGLVGRREGPLEETADAARRAGARDVLVLPADVRVQHEIASALGRAAEHFGPLHGLVANAGIGGPNGPDDQGGDRFEELVDTNLKGSYHTLRAFEPHVAEPQEQPRVVVVSSILGRIGVPGYTGYCASKAGLLGLVRAFAHEWAPRAIEVNALAPGWVATDMATEGLEGMAEGLGISFEAARARALEEVPLGRMSRPEEIAATVLWMLSAAARGMTGHTLDVNNGAFMA